MDLYLSSVEQVLHKTLPKMYKYLPTIGKSENKNMQNYALNLVNFGAHLSKILKYDIL